MVFLILYNIICLCHIRYTNTYFTIINQLIDVAFKRKFSQAKTNKKKEECAYTGFRAEAIYRDT